MSISFVFISATSSADVRGRALREGAGAYLFKPFSDEGWLEILAVRSAWPFDRHGHRPSPVNGR